VNSLSLTFAVGYEGRAVGTATSANLTTPLGKSVVLTSLTGSGKQVYEAWETPITLATSGSTTLNLLAGLVNPLGESISGTLAFTAVRDVFFQVGTSSPTAATIQVFGGTVGSQFQGPLPVTAAVALGYGQAFALAVPATATGWTVNSTAKNIEIRNVGTTAVTVNVFIAGNAG
jgi:hypothetical protein